MVDQCLQSYLTIDNIGDVTYIIGSGKMTFKFNKWSNNVTTGCGEINYIASSGGKILPIKNVVSFDSDDRKFTVNNNNISLDMMSYEIIVIGSLTNGISS